MPPPRPSFPSTPPIVSVWFVAQPGPLCLRRVPSVHEPFGCSQEPPLPLAPPYLLRSSFSPFLCQLSMNRSASPRNLRYHLLPLVIAVLILPLSVPPAHEPFGCFENPTVPLAPSLGCGAPVPSSGAICRTVRLLRLFASVVHSTVFPFRAPIESFRCIPRCLETHGSSFSILLQNTELVGCEFHRLSGRHLALQDA